MKQGGGGCRKQGRHQDEPPAVADQLGCGHRSQGGVDRGLSVVRFRAQGAVEADRTDSDPCDGTEKHHHHPAGAGRDPAQQCHGGQDRGVERAWDDQVHQGCCGGPDRQVPFGGGPGVSVPA